VLYFDPKVQAYLEKYHPWISFSVSIDGDKQLHDACRVFPDGSGSYDLAVAAAKDYMARYGEIGTKMTLAPGNVAYTARALENLIHIGYTAIFCNCVFEEGWQLEHAKILYRQMVEFADYLFDHDLHDEIYVSLYEEDTFQPMDEADDQNWCGGNGAMIAVDWKGDIFPCLRYMESSLGDDVPPIIIGTVDGGIEATPEQKHCVDCLQCMTRCSQSTQACIHCPIAKGCAWCSAYNYQYFGHLNERATHICCMHKARALANVYFWNKYYRTLGQTKRMPCHVPRDWALEIIPEEEYEMLLKLSNEGDDSDD
jgi:radical SAM peptide maturase (CXXX-repeat target family)